jgi:hypothetical protein
MNAVSASDGPVVVKVMNWVYKARDRDIINACKFVK